MAKTIEEIYGPKLSSLIKKRRRILRNLPSKFCPYCGDEMVPDYYLPKSMTIDHIVPLSRGGTDAPLNKTWCCYACNQVKGNLLIEEIFDPDW